MHEVLSNPFPIRIQVCERVAELYPKNYYAWTQRSWVILREVASATAGGGNASAKEQAAVLVSDLVDGIAQLLAACRTSRRSALAYRDIQERQSLPYDTTRE